MRKKGANNTKPGQKILEIPAPTGVLLFVYACHMWKSGGGLYVNVKLHFLVIFLVRRELPRWNVCIPCMNFVK